LTARGDYVLRIASRKPTLLVSERESM
ncbi:hypothetical protein M8C21_007521, partial [Ambrosia artemisiifolia]